MVGEGILWKQWSERHNPQLAKAVPVTMGDMLDVGPAFTPDDRYDREQDQLRRLKAAPEYWAVTWEAAKEAYWIEKAQSPNADLYVAYFEARGYATTPAAYVEKHLSREDVEAWHLGEVTKHVEKLMDDAGLDPNRQAIQIWGHPDGPEPVSVQIVQP